MYMYTIYYMTWKEQAPLFYMVITIAAALMFIIAFVIALRRQPHRFQRIRRFLCCLKSPLHSYTSVEEEDPFVIGDSDDEEQEIELPITVKDMTRVQPENMEAETV
jgi:hypothetical protein